MPHQCTNCERRFPDGSKEMLSGCPDCGGNKFQFTPATDASDETATAAATATGSASTESQPSPESGTAESTSRAGSTTEPSAERPSSRREWPETARRPAERDDVVDRSDSTTAGSRADGRSSTGTDAMEDDFEWVKGDEDDAQATARSDVVSPDELPTHGDTSETRTDRSANGPTDAPSTTPNQPATAGKSGADPSAEPPEDGRVVSEPEASQPSIEDLREELNQQFESIKILNPGQYELNLMELYDREEHIVSLQEDGRYVINVPESWHDEDS